jgi:tRNA pseudouridine55 synthase
VIDRPVGGSADRPVDGVLIIDKPSGPTSHDIVATVRRAIREKRIGHTGTLDPLATGVLALVIGKATRLASLLSSVEKEYEATVRLGISTDTYDALGQPASASAGPFSLEREQVERALDQFRGRFDQQPPPYSAKKVAGVPAYKLARKQKPADLTAVTVTVFSLDLLAFDETSIRLRMRTSAGFYVRSLAHDLGATLGCGGHLEALRRTRAGSFGLNRSVTLDRLLSDPAAALDPLIPIEEVLPELPAVRVTAPGAERAAHGNFLRPQDFAETGPVPGSRPGGAEPGTGPLLVRVFGPGGRLLAIAAAGPDGLLRPSIVLV